MFQYHKLIQFGLPSIHAKIANNVVWSTVCKMLGERSELYRAKQSLGEKERERERERKRERESERKRERERERGVMGKLTSLLPPAR